ncbi:MAG: hypothetical protein RMJ43_04480, partial [Chloroherpetonaceae bacterium]|nr:hypothetical protein [Chthonomonadaceae bacterium]MDW8207069.1 hypothetical protein [Chloroherpetonaceae bacterium]
APPAPARQDTASAVPATDALSAPSTTTTPPHPPVTAQQSTPARPEPQELDIPAFLRRHRT